MRVVAAELLWVATHHLLVVTDTAALTTNGSDISLLRHWIRAARLREVIADGGDRAFLRGVKNLLTERRAILLLPTRARPFP